MLALRTSDGLDMTSLGTRYGSEIVDQVLLGLEPYIRSGLVVTNDYKMDMIGREHSSSVPSGSLGCDTESIRHVRLKDPEGFILSNDIIASVFAEFLD